MRRVIRKDKIFIAISIVSLASLFIIYGYRFIHYYRLEANIVDDTEISEPISIYNHLLTYLPEDDILIQKENGLIKNEDNTYYFKGQVENNFVYYSGRLWRIIKTTKDKNIVLISEEIQTLMPYGEDIEYQNSYLYNYLNNIDEYSLFYKTLNNTDIFSKYTILWRYSYQYRKCNLWGYKIRLSNNFIKLKRLSKFRC